MRARSNLDRATRSERIDGRAVLDRHLAALAQADARLAPIIDGAGEVPLRLREGGFAGMAQIIVSQLLSVASAKAIHARFEQALPEMSARAMAGVSDAGLEGVGLSRAKIVCLRALADAELTGGLDYAALADLPVDEAMAGLMAVKGIGRWSAEVYLLFCTGHPDIFPSGDLALRKAVGHVLGLSKAPSEGEVRLEAQKWAPWRGAAARLMWRHYALMKAREGIM